MVDPHIEQHPVGRRQGHDAGAGGDHQQQDIQRPVRFKNLDADHHGHQIDQAHGEKLPEALVGILGIGHPVGESVAQEQKQDLDPGIDHIEESQYHGKCDPGQRVCPRSIFLRRAFQVLPEQSRKKYIEHEKSEKEAPTDPDSSGEIRNIRDRDADSEISGKDRIRPDQQRHHAQQEEGSDGSACEHGRGFLFDIRFFLQGFLRACCLVLRNRIQHMFERLEQ